MSPDYREIIRQLQDSGNYADIDAPVSDVGRNSVWKIGGGETDIDVFYVKFLDGERLYERELFGLTITRELAESHDWIMAPNVLYRDRDVGVYVTSSLSGEPLSTLIKRSHRIDNNPLHRPKPIKGFREALRSGIRWLKVLHTQKSRRFGALYNHSLNGVRNRIIDKLRRALRNDALSINSEIIARIEALSLPEPPVSNRLLCGDATLGNFVWDGQRIGRVDFEDFGWGSPSRDLLSLRRSLLKANKIPWYWSLQAECSMVADTAGEIESVLYRLEWCVDSHWRNYHSGSWWSARCAHAKINDLLQALEVL